MVVTYPEYSEKLKEHLKKNSEQPENNFQLIDTHEDVEILFGSNPDDQAKGLIDLGRTISIQTARARLFPSPLKRAALRRFYDKIAMQIYRHTSNINSPLASEARETFTRDYLDAVDQVPLGQTKRLGTSGMPAFQHMFATRRNHPEQSTAQPTNMIIDAQGPVAPRSH